MRFFRFIVLLFPLSWMLSGCHGEVRGALPSGMDSDTRKEAKQCDQGDQIACHNVALALEFYENAPPEQQELASQLLQRACENGLELSCRRLAHHAREAHQDPMAGEHILRRACSSGDRDSCVILANNQIEAGMIDTGVQNLLALCHEQSSRACVELGRHYLEGVRGEVEPELAIGVLSIPCAQGSPIACRLRGEAMLSIASSPDAITTDTIALFGNACLGAEELACRRLAGLYHHGVGVEQDEDYARVLLRRACAIDFATDECDRMTPPPSFPPATPPTDTPENMTP